MSKTTDAIYAAGMTSDALKFISEKALSGKNIMIVGATASGKTTLLNWLASNIGIDTITVDNFNSINRELIENKLEELSFENFMQFVGTGKKPMVAIVLDEAARFKSIQLVCKLLNSEYEFCEVGGMITACHGTSRGYNLERIKQIVNIDTSNMVSISIVRNNDHSRIIMDISYGYEKVFEYNPSTKILERVNMK